MLNDSGEQPENSHNNEAGSKNQGAVRKIEPCVQICLVKVSVELSDSESKPDKREGCTNPRHQRALRGLAVAFPREFVGQAGANRLVAHQQSPRFTRRGASSCEPGKRSGLVDGNNCDAWSHHRPDSTTVVPWRCGSHLPPRRDDRGCPPHHRWPAAPL